MADLWSLLVVAHLCEEVVHRQIRVRGELAVLAEDYHADLRLAQDGQLGRLLDQAALTLCEGHLAMALILDLDDVDFAPPHGDTGRRGL